LVKDLTGQAQCDYDAPEGMTAGELLQAFARKYPALGAWENSVLVAVNQTFVPRNHRLAENDEAALLPPVSGGQDPEGHVFALTRQRIDARELEAQLARGCDGALTTFQGITRDNAKGRQVRFLDYECYEPMALREMQAIGREIASRYAISRLGIIHRLGRLEIGEASVVIAVASPHRQAAFDACKEAIDTLKKRVPIWKKEFFADGEVWVEGQWDDSLLSL
jgi:molybdopterin synthase catalytic subunit